tara:strand:+ start:8272 stop:9018 length:747 start_codon:yes stop_codon:yes gene_type:complete
MNSIQATIRSSVTKGQLNSFRKKGEVPAVIYGGKEKNQNIFLPIKDVKILIEKENFLSKVITLKIDGNDYSVLPRDISYDVVSDNPIHLDFIRIVKGAKIILNIPVKFINNEKSPGLKRGGVLNIVRRQVELKCPTENIPTELVVDLDNLDIGASIKISSIKLPENVTPTIQGRDFVIATVAAPTIIKEPEKPAEETVEAGAEGAEGAEAAAEGTSEKPAEDSKNKEGEKKPKEGDKKDTEKAPPQKK